MQDPNQYLDDLIVKGETTGNPYIAGDVFAPAHEDGRSDLNLHTLDMLEGPDVSQDPYAPKGLSS